MKQLKTITTTLLSTLVLAGCGGSGSIQPSQNSALTSVSPSEKKTGYMQNSLDTWITEDWSPVVEKDPEIRKKYMEKVEATSSNKTATTQISTMEELNANTSENLSKKSLNKSNNKVVYVEKDDKPFTLQEFADKSAAYMKAQKNDESHSNVKKMDSMPVIGK